MLTARDRYRASRFINLDALLHMSLPNSVDFDRLVRIALDELGAALSAWIDGEPKDEVALLSHITGRLNRRRRACDVGNATPVRMETRLSMLHRRGARQTDRYGCDLGLTVSIPADGFLKTACFQLKRSTAYTVSVERTQLEDAAVDQRIVERAFLAAADEIRAGIRIRSTADLIQEFDAVQATKQFGCATWDSLVPWTEKWLRCDVGPVSDPEDPDRIEVLLSKYEIAAPTPRRDLAILDEAEREVIPARAWLRLTFLPSER